MERLIKLEWYNSTDIINTLYQTGYKRHGYFYAFFDRPVTEKNIEERQDGYLNSKTVFANFKTRTRFEFMVNDEMLRALHWLEAHSTATIKFIDTGETFTMEDVKIEASELTGSNAYQKCTVTFVSSSGVKSCEEDYTLI